MKLIRVFTVFLIQLCFSTFAQEKSNIHLRLIGEFVIPHNFSYEGTCFGGISGIDKLSNNQWVFISDDMSERNPSRIYTVQILYDAFKIDTVFIDEVIFLKTKEDNFFSSISKIEKVKAKNVSDSESIRYNVKNNSLICTNEGFFDNDILIQPTIWETDMDGKFIKYIDVPKNLFFDTLHMQGLRHNLTFEGISLSEDGNYLWVSNEGSLIQDGATSNALNNSPIRISKVKLASGKLEAQYSYLPDKTPIQPDDVNDFSENGISEILSLSDNKLLVLERSYTQRKGNSIRLYETDFSKTENIMDSYSLEKPFKIANKKNILDFSALKTSKVDNIEAMAWGTILPNGNRSIVFVSDNNFNDRQISQIIICELIEEK